MQLVEPDVVQPSMLLPPGATEAGVAVKLTVGAGVDEATFTVTDLAALPPCALTQVRVNVVVADRGPRLSLPLVGLLPVHPPLAVHEFAPLLDQLRVVIPPLGREVGFAVRFTVGTGVPVPALCL